LYIYLHAFQLLLVTFGLDKFLNPILVSAVSNLPCYANSSTD
jgi:hypothetical protein